MKQRKYNVTLAGRPWTGVEAQERYAELPLKPTLVDGRLYITHDERLEMLAALLEHCGAAAAVQIGDPEVWREAVRAVSSGQLQPFGEEKAPVMGSEVLAIMPFNDDPSLGELTPIGLPYPGLPKSLGDTLRRLDTNDEAKD